MYDLYEARNSIYCYENTDILKNKLNIKLYMKGHFLHQKDVLTGGEDKMSHLYKKGKLFARV